MKIIVVRNDCVNERDLVNAIRPALPRYFYSRVEVSVALSTELFVFTSERWPLHLCVNAYSTALDIVRIEKERRRHKPCLSLDIELPRPTPLETLVGNMVVSSSALIDRLFSRLGRKPSKRDLDRTIRWSNERMSQSVTATP
jgi:hypothetical protein